MTDSNIMKGRVSKDAFIDGTIVPFINRNSSEYPVEVGAAFFAPMEVQKVKDQSLNVAKEHAKQEYDRIMEMVTILQEQAKALVDRLDASELVHSAEFGIITTHNRAYHIYFDSTKNKNVLSPIGPTDWSSGRPVEHLQFVASVNKKGDSTWEYVDEDSVSN
jgi:hypothetical protein